MKTDRFADRIRELALSFPEAYEDEPWGHPVFKVADNKMFASMSAEPPIRLTVKLTAEERGIAMLLPFVSIARYVGRYGWITAEVTDEESLDHKTVERVAAQFYRQLIFRHAVTSRRRRSHVS